ncbi:spike base protein, RCAP_Rcc01079 family [Polymorphum gilvum]|uniref:Uncharacterized protein n=1 Tax=Polymorphum gilvum (strain LMG 25793 / CGMCC 1.9160 / SL003B-26A1) TaxID=991905 RepID=F2J5N2_POLGS|nr:hypothetical protein [Polymorphum gilvum]ADZ70116.1 hypothetical protein SL003B_1688 [Polymorphum gilvum SL003B-26A1]
MAADPYATVAGGPDSFGRKARIVTPAASDIDPIPKAVVLCGPGDITVVPADNADGDTVAFTDVGAGFVPPFRVRRVTAATAVVATIED